MVLSACALVPATVASAALAGLVGTPIGALAAPAELSAFNDAVAWTALDPTTQRASLIVRDAGGERQLGIASQPGGFPGLSLGSDAAGRTIALFSRCPADTSPTAVLAGAAIGCRLDEASLQTGAERPVAGASGVIVATARAGRVAFVRMRDHVPTLWLGELSDIAAARELPLLDPQHPSSTSPRPVVVPRRDLSISAIDLSGSRVAYIEHYTTNCACLGHVSVLAVDFGRHAPRKIAEIALGGASTTDRYLLGAQFADGELFDFQYGDSRDGFPAELQAHTLSGKLVATATIGLPQPGSQVFPHGLEVTGAAYDDGHLYYAVAPEDSSPTNCDVDDGPPAAIPSGACAVYDAGLIHLTPTPARTP
jgi:hypothetical protein